MIKLYTLPVCPNCEHLKQLLSERNIAFESYDLENEDIRLGLLMKSVTLTEAPIIEIDGKFFDMITFLKEMGI